MFKKKILAKGKCYVIRSLLVKISKWLFNRKKRTMIKAGMLLSKDPRLITFFIEKIKESKETVVKRDNYFEDVLTGHVFIGHIYDLDVASKETGLTIEQLLHPNLRTEITNGSVSEVMYREEEEGGI